MEQESTAFPQGFVVVSAAKRESSETGKENTPLFSRFLVRQDDSPAPDYLLSSYGVPFLPKGDIHAIKAKPKSGKTLFMAVLAASTLGARQFGLSTLSKDATVLYADTEQNRRNTSAFVYRVNDILSYQSHNLYALSLREVSSPESKLDIIISAIASLRPALTIIDGIADIVADFNDIENSAEVISILSKLAQQYNTAIINVLHTNKAQGDTNMKGHLGSLLLQKSSDVFEVKRNCNNGNIFTVSQTDTRNAPISPIKFYIEEEERSIPEENPDSECYTVATPLKIHIKPYKRDSDESGDKVINSKFSLIMAKYPNGIKYSQLATELAEILNKSERTAKNLIKKALEEDNIIYKNEEGLLLLREFKV